MENMNFREFYMNDVENIGDMLAADSRVLDLYLHNPKIGVREIARQTGSSIGEVYRILQRSGHSPNRLHLNHDNVRHFSDSGMTTSKVAELTGYSQRNVRYIKGKGRNDDQY